MVTPTTVFKRPAPNTPEINVKLKAVMLFPIRCYVKSPCLSNHLKVCLKIFENTTYKLL